MNFCITDPEKVRQVEFFGRRRLAVFFCLRRNNLFSSVEGLLKMNQNRNLRNELNTFSLPLVGKNIVQLIVEFWLAVVSGHISANAIAVIGTVDGLLYSLIGILGSGTVSYMIYASRVEDKHSPAARTLFKSLLLLNLGLGVLFVSLGLLFSGVILKGIYRFDGELLELGNRYMRISSWHILLTLCVFSLSNQLKVVKKTGAVFRAGVFSNGVQLALTWLLAVQLLTGNERILGIACAGLASEAILCLYYGWLLRDELAALRGIRGERWLFLLKKSGILFLQELLEGSVFQVLLTAALVRLGGLIFAAYQVCRTLTEIFLAPMFMYCSGLLVLIGEKIGKRELDEARQLPKITLQLIIGIYGILAICSWFWQKSLISLVTDIPQVAQTAVSVLGVVILCEITRPFYEVHKYSLQALSGEEVALKITACVNGLVLLLLWLLPNRLEVILLLAAAGNLGAAGAFQLSFKRRLCRIRHGEEK